MQEEQQELFQQDVKTRQGKLKYLFEREDQNNGAKKHVHKTETSSEVTCIEKFYYPKILLERYTKNSFVKYDLYNTNSDMYTPVSDEHIELCMEHGLAVYSRTLRISSKKRQLKNIKNKNRLILLAKYLIFLQLMTYQSHLLIFDHTVKLFLVIKNPKLSFLYEVSTRHSFKNNFWREK